MNVEDISTVGVIPSRFSAGLLSIVGHRIVDATRYSWWTPQEAQRECGVVGGDFFSLTAGPATIAFDSGLVLGIASDPSQDSVTVWAEKNEVDQLARKKPLSSDEELYPVSAKDPNFANIFWHQAIGEKVVAISILMRKVRTARLAELPNEVGLCFLLDSGAKLVAAHGLHDNSDDFSIIPDQLILDTIRADLEEIPVG